MRFTRQISRFLAGAATVAMLATAAPSVAQEITEDHLKAARMAIASIQATDQFDAILPELARRLKEELLRKDPNLEQLIDDSVNEVAIELAVRRADLENEAARAYANAFTAEELTAIADFYNSEAGKKLLSEGPIATREVLKAADIWQTGIGRDLSDQVGKKLAEKVAELRQNAPAQPAPAPEDGTAPADGDAAPAQ